MLVANILKQCGKQKKYIFDSPVNEYGEQIACPGHDHVNKMGEQAMCDYCQTESPAKHTIG